MRWLDVSAISACHDDMDAERGIGQLFGLVVGALIFLGTYAYCIGIYGFLLGGAFGWIPALIVASGLGLAVRYLGNCVLDK